MGIKIIKEWLTLQVYMDTILNIFVYTYYLIICTVLIIYIKTPAMFNVAMWDHRSI